MMKSVLVLLALFSVSTRAETTKSERQVEGNAHKVPCVEEHKQFCPKTTAFTESWVGCMQKHFEELDAECQAKVTKFGEKLNGVKDAAKKNREACRDDFFKLCQGTPLEENERRACLMRHKSKLSEACRQSFKLNK